MVISPTRPAWARPAVNARVQTPSNAMTNRMPVDTRPISRASGTTNSGSTVSMVRPGNHQPIMVTATKVAISSWITMRVSSKRCSQARRASNASAGATASNSGAQRPSPKRRSTNSPQIR